AGLVVTAVEIQVAGNVPGGAQLTVMLGLVGQETLEEIPRIPHQCAGLIPDREGARAIGIQLVIHQQVPGGGGGAAGIEQHRTAVGILAIAIDPADIQPAQLIIVPAGARVGGGGAAVAEGVRVEQGAVCQGGQLRRQVVTGASAEAAAVDQVLDAEFLDEALAGIPAPVGIVILTPGAGVAFVGRDDIGLAVDVVAADGIRMVDADHTGTGFDADQAILLVTGINAVAFRAIVLEAEGQDIGDGGAGDVQSGQGVVLLLRNPGGAAVGRYGDVFRLQVPGDAGDIVRPVGAGIVGRPEQAHAGGEQGVALVVELGEAGGAYGAEAVGISQDFDQGDGAFGVLRIVVIGFALIGDQHMAAVRGEGHRVRQGADRGAVQPLQGGRVVQLYGAGAGLGRGFDGDREQPVMPGNA